MGEPLPFFIYDNCYHCVYVQPCCWLKCIYLFVYNVYSLSLIVVLLFAMCRLNQTFARDGERAMEGCECRGMISPNHIVGMYLTTFYYYPIIFHIDVGRYAAWSMDRSVARHLQDARYA